MSFDIAKYPTLALAGTVQELRLLPKEKLPALCDELRHHPAEKRPAPVSVAR